MFFGQLDAVFRGAGDGVGVGHPGAVIDSGILFNGLDHRHALPLAEFDGLALVVDRGASAHLLRDGLHHLLDEVHDAAEVGVGLVKLDRRELGVVLRVHPFVAEYASDLVDLVHAADDQPLEIELGLDAQDHVHVERVVMRVEGPGGRTDLERG